ncbi:MAG: CheR family methyltransferase, partial [Myxococcota bacterium]
MAERTIQETLAQTVRQQLGYTPSKLDGHIKRLLSGDADPKNDLAGLVDRLLDAATINHTELFRHPEQFREFEERLRSLEARQSTISIWSAACATGEEAYSIAQVVRRRNVNASILATDISDAALAEARNPSPRRAKRLAQQGISDPEALRGMIQFTRHSLVSPLPSHLPQTFDFIFCRNVLIYFSPADASALLGRLVRRIASAGSLFVAPVESLLGTPEGFVAGETLGVFNRTQAETKVPSGPTGIQSETERREIQLLSDVLEDDDQEASES